MHQQVSRQKTDGTLKLSNKGGHHKGNQQFPCELGKLARDTAVPWLARAGALLPLGFNEQREDRAIRTRTV